MPEAYSNGQNMAANEAALQRGTAHAPRCYKNGCHCLGLLQSLSRQVDAANRTVREVKKADSAAGGRGESVHSAHNYASLGLVAIDLLFEGRGNWVLHEGCARRYLGVSNFWLARCHSRAIDAAQVHKVRMTTSAFAGSSKPDLLIYRIRRPDDCLLSALQCYRSCALNTVLIVTSSVDHGFTGSPSNRTNVAEKKLLFDVVQANLSSTGHAADKNGHYRGSASILNPSGWCCAPPEEAPKTPGCPSQLR